MRKLSLKWSTNKQALVDDEDYQWAKKYQWYYSNGYAFRFLPHSGRIVLHREVFIRHGNSLSEEDVVDHQNLSKLDCRYENLRKATVRENRYNVPSIGGTSRYKGLYFNKDKRKWHAQYTDENGKRHHIGYYLDEADAAIAYDNYAEKVQGSFFRRQIDPETKEPLEWQ